MKILVALCLLSFASITFGCKYAPDNRPLEDQLKESPIAFIGQVTRLTLDGIVEFKIEHILNGNHDGSIYVFKNEGTSCDINFTVGQRWIYGGQKLYNPSVLLNNHGLERHNDTKLQLPSKWQACSSDAECGYISYGCDATSANKIFTTQATDQARTIGGDPSAISCVTPDKNFSKILCQKSICGVFSLVSPS